MMAVIVLRNGVATMSVECGSKLSYGKVVKGGSNCIVEWGSNRVK